MIITNERNLHGFTVVPTATFSFDCEYSACRIQDMVGKIGPSSGQMVVYDKETNR